MGRGAPPDQAVAAAAVAEAAAAAEEEEWSKLRKKVLEQERKRALKCFDDDEGRTFTKEMAVRVCEKHSLTHMRQPPIGVPRGGRLAVER